MIYNDMYEINDTTLVNIANTVKQKCGSHDYIKGNTMITAMQESGNPTWCDSEFMHTWKRPSDWDDIESMKLSDDHDEFYWLVRGNHELAKYYFYIVAHHKSGSTWDNSWTATIDVGHVSDGVFTPIPNKSQTIQPSSGTADYKYVTIDLTDTTDDYLVIQCVMNKGSYLQTFSNCTTTGIIAQDYIGTTTAIYMIYGSARCWQGNLDGYGTRRASLSSQCALITLQSICIWDAGVYTLDYNPSFAGLDLKWLFSYSPCLHRIHFPNNNIKNLKVKKIEGMYYNAAGLYDLDDDMRDMTGWISSTTQPSSSSSQDGQLFSGCTRLSGTIKVNDWDFASVNHIGQSFQNMYCINRIEGMDTWVNTSHLTNTSLLTSNCYNLHGDYTFVGFTNTGTTCTLAQSTSLYISSLTFKNCTFAKTPIDSSVNSPNVNITYKNCTFTGSTSYLSNYFTATSPLYPVGEVLFDTCDFSGVTGKFSLYTSGIASIPNTVKSITFKNCTMPSTMDSMTGSGNTYMMYYLNCPHLDLSGLDYSTASADYHTWLFQYGTGVVEFYPPAHLHLALNFTGTPNLSHDSLVRILNALDTVSTTQNINMPSDLKDKLTADEIAIATDKGWTFT